MKVVREDILAAIRQANVVADPGTLREDIKLGDQGIDSLGVFSVILALQEKYGIEIPDADVDKLDTIEMIVTYLHRRLG